MIIWSFTVKTQDLKEALNKLTDSVRRGRRLYLDPEKRSELLLWVLDNRYEDAREVKIPIIIIGKYDSGLIGLEYEQLKEVKKAIRYYKGELVKIILKDNGILDKRMPNFRRFSLVINDTEIVL